MGFEAMREYNQRSFICLDPDYAAATAVRTVITDLGVLERNPSTGDLELAALHPGVTVDDTKAATGWPLASAARVATLASPTANELELLRELQPA